MPRTPRIDSPGFLYHVIARGIERRQIFADDQDRQLFLDKLGDLVLETGTPIYSFALIPNHFHFLLRRGRALISSLMHRLLTSYAVRFNMRHQRSGHLFQNRYKSFFCQDEIHFLELIRYVNLNPLKAGVVSDFDALGRYRFCSHRFLCGAGKAGWFDPGSVLSLLGIGSMKRGMLT